jgi:hypothetical protein
MFRAVLVLLMLLGVADARGTRRAQVPNGSLIGCNLCHVPGQPKTRRNPFGAQVEETLVGQAADWTALWDLDADLDGFTNGVELGDPDGVWAPGQPNPDYVSHPGDRFDSPPPPKPDMFVAEPDGAAPEADAAPDTTVTTDAMADPDAGLAGPADAIGINPINEVDGGGGGSTGCQSAPVSLLWIPLVFGRRRR